MSDIFAPLREPESVSPPPPEEIRRRGDRLRRRRGGLAVGGAVSVAVLLLASTSLVGDWARSDSPPGPIDSPAAELVTPEFDLADGATRELASASAGAPPLRICGETVTIDDRSTDSQGIVQEQTGDLVARG